MSFNNFGWGAPITVKGETGATGATGATGPQGPQGNPTTITSADTNLLTVSTVGSTATLTPTSNIMTTNTDQAVNSVKTFDSKCLEINDLKLAADGSIMTFPTGGDDTVITSLATQDLVNKGLNMELGYFYSNTGANRKVMFRFTPVAPVGNNTTSEIRFASTASRLWTHPDKSGTYAMTSDIITPAYGTIEATSSNATATTISVQNIFTQILGTWTAGLMSNFTSPSNGVLQCGRTAIYCVNYNAALLGNSNFQLSFCLYINGVQLTRSTAVGHVHTSPAGATISNSVLVSLTSGDQLTLRIANNTNTNSVTVQWYNIVATQLI